MEIKLNLIPPNKKEEIGKNRRLKMVIRTEIVLTIVAVVFLAVLLSFRYSLELDLAGEEMLNSQIEKADQFEKIKNYDNQFNQANERIGQIADIDQAQLYWSKIFEKISQLTPAGIEVQTFSTDQDAMVIAGLSDTRDNLIEFKANLEENACFSDVVLPLSNLVDKTDVDFKINFNVKENCLKK